MDVHAVEVLVGAVIVAAGSGFGGVWFGARTTTRHDRIERARSRRIAAADDLVRAWATALFAIDAAIRELETPTGVLPVKIAQAHDDVTTAVKLSVRVDLLFGTTSLTSAHTNAVRDEAREAIHAIETGDVNAARQNHGDASMSHAWLVIAAAEAIQSTGEKSDVARTFKAVLEEPEIDPDMRTRSRQGG